MPADMEEDPSSFLAATGPLEQDLDLSTSDQDAAQAVSDGLRDAKAPNTRRAYASAWHTFLEWTILTGRESMPAAPQSVALYLGHLAAEGKSLATINRRPEPQSPTPLPRQGYPRTRTPPAIRSWPKWSRDGGTHLQRPHRSTR